MGEATQNGPASRWTARVADALHRAEVTPNQLSVGSMVFAVAGVIGLAASGVVDEAHRPGFLVMAAVCIPMRLLLLMLGRALATDKDLHSPVSDLYHEVPDRIADVMVIGAAGYAAAGLWTVGAAGTLDLGVLLGFVAATLAVLTAYVRALGASYGLGEIFRGPMPHPVRLWVLVIACLLSVAEPLVGIPTGAVMLAALALIALGSLSTVMVRLRLIAAALRTGQG